MIFNNDTEETEKKSRNTMFREIINDHTIEISMNEFNPESVQLKNYSLPSLIDSSKNQFSDAKSKPDKRGYNKNNTQEGSNFGSAVNAMISETINEEDSDSDSLPTIENKNKEKQISKISIDDTPSSFRTQPFFKFSRGTTSKTNLNIFNKYVHRSITSSQNMLKSIHESTPISSIPEEQTRQKCIENAIKSNINLLSLIKKSSILHTNLDNNQPMSSTSSY